MKSWAAYLGYGDASMIETPQKIVDFFNEIDEICKKHNLSISHEDGHGAFQIDKYNEDNIDWLKDATLIHNPDDTKA